MLVSIISKRFPRCIGHLGSFGPGQMTRVYCQIAVPRSGEDVESEFDAPETGAGSLVTEVDDPVGMLKALGF